MALASTNAWKVNIEETIQSAIRNEFKASLPTFRSKVNKLRGNQFVVIQGNESNPNQTMFAKLSSTYNLTINFFMLDEEETIIP